MNVVDMHCDTIAELYYSHRDGEMPPSWRIPCTST